MSHVRRNLKLEKKKETVKNVYHAKTVDQILRTSEMVEFRTDSKLTASYQFCLNIFRALPKCMLQDNKEYRTVVNQLLTSPTTHTYTHKANREGREGVLE